MTMDQFYMRYFTPLDFHMRTNGLIQGTTLKVSKKGGQYFKKRQKMLQVTLFWENN